MDTDTKPTDIEPTVEPPKQEPATKTEPAVVAPSADDSTLAWAKTLDEIDAASLRKHPKIAGMIGSEAQRLVQAKSHQDQATEAQRVRDATEAELLKFSEANADYLKENYPQAYQHIMGMQQDRARREIEGLRGKTRDELAQRVGASIRQLPEFAEFTQDDHEKLIKAVTGKPDDEVIAIYNLTALDIAAEKRLAKMLAKETVKIREAVRQEEAAKLMKESDALDLAKPKATPGKSTPASMTKEEFDLYWESLKQPRS